MKNPTETDLLGFEVTFSLPDWFPPEAANYRYAVMYPRNHIWAGQVEKVLHENHAKDALFALPHVREADTMGICGSWVTFRFDGIYPADAGDKVADCEAALNDLLKTWCWSITGHEYLIQKRDEGGYEVLDLTVGGDEAAYVDDDYDECQRWIDEPHGRYWIVAKAKDYGFYRMGPFIDHEHADKWADQHLPHMGWDEYVVSDVGEEEE